MSSTITHNRTQQTLAIIIEVHALVRQYYNDQVDELIMKFFGFISMLTTQQMY